MQMATSENELQTVGNHLKLIAKIYKMNISSTKTNTMTMCGNHIQRLNTVTNDSPTEQISDFKYPGYLISDYKRDLEDTVQPNKKKQYYMETFWRTDG